jgi:putative hydrolase of HD superfamily
MLHNYQTQGKAWQQHGITSDQVIAHNRHMAEGAPRLWEYARNMVREAVERGYLEA